ncbi:MULTISPECIES: hypothetical protein [unclassified Hahella]|uniref:hypothetical protein n=1 Tax=unclassified Hahella TaxID=2624107 RepID=UPI001C1E96B6|nr:MULTISPECIES: hypothetical protein [unclassified Hahella]MBU6951351.1 hypothetical protein [Hahella sp. HN01]MDG9670623.1 hypothetical protein [Hahella sp. CR1]
MALSFSHDIDLYNQGILTIHILKTYVIRRLALEGSQEDYDRVPSWLRDEINRDIKKFHETGVWMIVSNEGVENFEVIAKRFSTKFGDC